MEGGFLISDLFDNSIVDHKFFSRLNGNSIGFCESLSFGRNDPNVKKNLYVIADQFNVDVNRVKMLDQTHTNKTILIDNPEVNTSTLQADALVTNIRGTVLGVVTADCCPVLLADEKNGIIGAAHAGWRGALSGIVNNTIEQMIAIGASVDHIKAATGPCISQTSYEVDKVFHETFITQDSRNQRFFIDSINDGHFMFDLPGYVVNRLHASGIQHIDDVGVDTYSNEHMFFSCRRAFHRKEQGFGVQMSAIKLL